MIFGNLVTRHTALLPRRLLSILNEHAPSVEALTRRDDGRHTLEGEDIFLILSQNTTQPAQQRRVEFHRDYLDIQILLEGQEWIGIGPFGWLPPGIPFEKPDAGYVDALPGASHVLLEPGDFAVFYPGEPHQALCTLDRSSAIRKAVIKVHRRHLS